MLNTTADHIIRVENLISTYNTKLLFLSNLLTNDVSDITSLNQLRHEILLSMDCDLHKLNSINEFIIVIKREIEHISIMRNKLIYLLIKADTGD